MLNHCVKTMSAMPNLGILLEDNAFFPKAFIYLSQKESVTELS